jgi:hypothetical protein
MKRIFTLAIVAIMGLWVFAPNLQAQCTYQVKLYDSFGDGWNGNTIDIKSATTTTTYTLDNGNDTTINLLINTGDSIVLDYLGGGSFNSEVSFELIDPSSTVIYNSGGGPSVGVAYADTAFCASCLAPNAQTTNTVSPTSVDLDWNEQNSATEWEIEYGTSSFTQGTGTVIHVTTALPYNLSGLSAGTAYDWYVRSICGVGDTSSWSAVSSFNTLCNAFSIPYVETFNSSSTTQSCWTVVDANSDGDTWDMDETYAPFEGDEGVDMYTDFNSGANDDYLISPTITLSANQRLRYYVRARSSFEPNDYEVLVSTTGVGTALFTDTLLRDTLDVTSYQERIIDLSAYSGNVNVAFHIPQGGLDGYYLYIDSVSFEDIPNCMAPNSLISSNISTNSADLSWTELNSATEWEVEYGVTGFTQGTGTVINVTTTPTLSISSLSANTTYDWYVRSICSVSDTSSRATASFTTNCPIYTPNYLEDFANFVPSCWVEAGSGSPSTGPSNLGSGLWTGDDFLNSSSNSRAAKINLYTTSREDWIISPRFDLSSGGPYQLVIEAGITDYANTSPENMGSDDTVQVVISVDSGLTWTPIYTWDVNNQPSNTGSQHIINLSTYTTNNNIIAIWGKDGPTNDVEDYDFFINSFEIRTTPLCPEPTSLVSTINPGSIDLDWTENGTATQWQIEYDTSGFTLGTGIDSIVNSKPKTLSALQSNTTYDWYVRAICGPADTSIWSIMGSFTTPCAPITAPWVENFPTNSLPNCWVESGNTTWEYGSGATTPTGFAAYGAGNVPDHTPGGGGTFIGMDGSDNSGSDSSDLTTPLIDVSTLTTPRLEFYIFSNNTNDAALNKTIVEFYDGANWHDVDSIQANLGTNWDYRIINLSSYTITGPVKARFTITPTTTGGSAFYNDILLDDIGFLETPTCPDPTNFVSTPTSTTSADVSWTSTASAPNAIVEYGTAGFSLGSGTRIVSTSTTESITGLIPNFAYDAYVKDSCAVGDTSAWVGPITFGGDVVACDDFDTYSAGNAASQSILINGWGGSVAGGGDAEISTDYANSGTQSLKIHDSGVNTFSDVVAEIGTYSSGMWNVAIDLYVPSGNGGYYNILHNYTGATNVWAIEVNLDSNGTATVVEGTNGTATIGTYTYNTGAWNTIEHIIDLDNDTAYIRVNGVNTTVGWQFSLGSANFGDQFNALNFFSAAPTGHTPLIYFDNFCISEVPPHYPIGIINTEDASGNADSVNVECSISGTVVGYDRRGGSGYEFALIDLITGVQEGITVFNFNDVSGYTSPTEGDSLLIFGSVDQFRGLTQFRPDSIVVLGSGTVPTADSATTLDETTESILIQMNDWVLLDATQASGSYNVEARNLASTDTITIRIDSDSDISDSLAIVGNGWVVGDTICSLVGVGSQFDFNSPFLDSYQVFPSLYTDVTVCKLFTGIQKVTAKDKAINIFPNPTVGQFTVAANGLNNDNAIVTVRDISGKIVLQDNIANSNSPFTKQYDLSGKAKGLYFISIIDGEERINQKLIVQ